MCILKGNFRAYLPSEDGFIWLPLTELFWELENNFEKYKDEPADWIEDFDSSN